MAETGRASATADTQAHDRTAARTRARIPTVVAAALVVALLAAYALRPSSGVPGGAPTEEAMATAIGSDIMRHIYRGHVPGRSGEIMTVPRPHRFLIGPWDLTKLGARTPELQSSHPNPWAYTARIPLVFYGPGRVRAGVEVADPVDLVAVAPTYAALLGMEDVDSDGEPLAAVVASARGAAPPRAIVTVVLDGGGWNVLQEHPHAWPTIARLAANGTSYLDATIGTAPSITGAVHATLGTGDYPIHHGVPGNQMRGPDGRNTDVFRHRADPTYMKGVTVSELWDERTGNRAWVGTVAYEGWHLGMIGHGAQREGGDRDVAVLWDDRSSSWWTNEDFYELPSYLETTDRARLATYEERLDPRDGMRDGRWFGHGVRELRDFRVRAGTPAFARFTGDAVMEVLRGERLGRDRVTDLLWVEFKTPDYAGHRWNMVSPEEGDVVAETDAQVARIERWLERHVGRGDYLLAITADHGQEPLPEEHGGWRINSTELERDIEERFGTDIVEKVTTVDVFMDRAAVARAGVDLGDVARYIGSYTVGENVDDQPGSDFVPTARLQERLFAGAFSTGYLQALTPAEIASFGGGDYEEARLYRQRPG